MRVDSGKRFALGGRFRHGFTCLNKQALHYFQSVFPVFPLLSGPFSFCLPALSCFGTGGADPDGIWRDLLLSRYIMENLPQSCAAECTELCKASSGILSVQVSKSFSSWLTSTANLGVLPNKRPNGQVIYVELIPGRNRQHSNIPQLVMKSSQFCSHSGDSHQ